MRARSLGFSLIELLLVLGVVSGILVMAFIAYPKVQAASRSKTEAEHITFITHGVKSLYAMARNYGTPGSNLNQILLNAKVIPDDLPTAGSTISNPWDGQVNVYVDSSPFLFVIVYNGVPSTECSKIGATIAVNYVRFTINGQVVFNAPPGSGSSPNLDPALVASYCASSNSNTLAFTSQ